jgi:hypothetical protein
MRLTNLFALLVTLVTWTAHAQTSSQSLDSMRSPFGQRVLILSVQLTRLDAVTGNTVAITGQSVSLGSVDIVKLPTLFADFPGRASGMVVSGLRLTVAGSGLGWKIPASRPLQVEIPLTITTVPAGKVFGVRYDMPLTGTGTIQTIVGATAASIPAPVVAGPVVTGPIVPLPPVPVPAPPPGISPVGTTAVPGQTVTTSQGTWSFDPVSMGGGGNVLLLNGNPAGGSGIKFVVTVDGLKVLNNTGEWWLWNGAGWGTTTAP